MKINNSRKMKQITVVVLAFCMLTLAGCGKAKTGEKKDNKKLPDVVNIGVQTLITPELITRYENSYEKYIGTKVNIVQLDADETNKALSSGSIDIASMGSSSTSIGIAKNMGYEVFWCHDVIGTAESLVATNKSNIKKMEDLVGKKVACPFTSTAHYSLLSAVKLAGMDASQIELLDMQPDAIYAAWMRGDIDAAYVWNPVLSELEKDGTVLTDSEALAKQDVVTCDVAVIRKEFAKSYPDVPVGYAKSQLHALDVFANDRDTAIQAISKVAEISEEEAKMQIETFIYPTGEELIGENYFGTKEKKGKFAQYLKSTADFWYEQGDLEKQEDLSYFEENVTGEFIEKAMGK